MLSKWKCGDSVRISLRRGGLFLMSNQHLWL